MKLRLYILPLFVSLFSFGQTTKDVVNDFDEDGIDDVLKIYSDLGKLMKCEYTDGTSGKTFVFNYSDQKFEHSIINLTPIPSFFESDEQKSVVGKIDSIIAPFLFKSYPDPSLQWIIDISVNRINIDSSTFFTTYTHYDPQWNSSSPEYGSDYKVKIKSFWFDSISNVLSPSDTISNWGYLSYKGSTHNSAADIDNYQIETKYPQFVDSIWGIKVFKTGHGLFIKKDSLYSWVFTSDGSINDNIQKLEWQSILDIDVYDTKLFVLNHPVPAIQNKLFMVDYQTGQTYEIKSSFLFKEMEEFRYIQNIEVMEDHLYIYAKPRPSSSEFVELSFKIPDLIEEAKKYSK